MKNFRWLILGSEFLDYILIPLKNLAYKLQRKLLRITKYFKLGNSILKSKLLSRYTKITIYKAIIILVVIYGLETRTLTKKIKLLSYIFCPIKEECMSKKNKKLKATDQKLDLVTTVKYVRVRWYGMDTCAEQKVKK